MMRKTPKLTFPQALYDREFLRCGVRLFPARHIVVSQPAPVGEDSPRLMNFTFRNGFV